MIPSDSLHNSAASREGCQVISALSYIIPKYFLGRFAAASVDYEAALEIDPFDTYSMMWRYLAALRNQEDPAEAREALRSGLRDVDAGRWPAVVASHLAGRATVREVLAEIDGDAGWQAGRGRG